MNTKRISMSRDNFENLLVFFDACRPGLQWFNKQKGTVDQILDRARKSKNRDVRSYYIWLMKRFPVRYPSDACLFISEKKMLPVIKAFKLPQRSKALFQANGGWV